MTKLKWINHSDLAIVRNGEKLSRKDFLDWMTFKGGRIPFTELFGPLTGMKEAWEEQGATQEELDFSAFEYRVPEYFFIPVNAERMNKERKEISNDGKIIRYMDDIGRTLELQLGYATIPLPLNYPVKNMDDWLKIKPKYEFSEERFSENWEEETKEAIAEDKVIKAVIPGGFDEPRQLLGEENLCYACYEQPELIHDILNTIGDTAYKVLDRVTSKVQVDFLAVHEDMAGKSGPLFGPNQIREFVKPYYRKVWDLMKSRGAKIFDQDSDGDMRPVISALIDAGINCMDPFEPAAGMDMVKIRDEYGKQLMIVGGLDKFVLTKSKEDIEQELEYKLPAMIKSGGGCILSMDHRLPAEVTLGNYKFYIKKAWEIIKREEQK